MMATGFNEKLVKIILKAITQFCKAEKQSRELGEINSSSKI